MNRIQLQSFWIQLFQQHSAASRTNCVRLTLWADFELQIESDSNPIRNRIRIEIKLKIELKIELISTMFELLRKPNDLVSLELSDRISEIVENRRIRRQIRARESIALWQINPKHRQIIQKIIRRNRRQVIAEWSIFEIFEIFEKFSLHQITSSGNSSAIMRSLEFVEIAIRGSDWNLSIGNAES